MTTADPIALLPPLQALRRTACLPPSDFRLAMRRLAGAVCIVATTDGQRLTGLTATAVTSLSAEPARLLACINLKGSTFRVVADSRRMSVNLLAQAHTGLAQRFGGAGPGAGELFETGRWDTLATGAPILRDALVGFDCVVDEMMVAHSHAVMIGEIKAVQMHPGNQPPLLYAEGRYTTLAPQGDIPT
ncbi:flavin reductase family protein [Xenophilus sp.]|jgi:flavin reductase (DIM6/NTAB) family NADH-FMN oxidoreductase RutF|uniref:flavin reductase family protein n=1 Tax=Xenophilus sp. TaxID=1873499 RepID=UPI0037DC1BB9